jgi:hypothetical protein
VNGVSTSRILYWIVLVLKIHKWNTPLFWIERMMGAFFSPSRNSFRLEEEKLASGCVATDWANNKRWEPSICDVHSARSCWQNIRCEVKGAREMEALCPQAAFIIHATIIQRRRRRHIFSVVCERAYSHYAQCWVKCEDGATRDRETLAKS